MEREWYPADFTIFNNCPWESCKFCDKERQEKCKIIRSYAIEEGRLSSKEFGYKNLKKETDNETDRRS